MGRRRIDWDLEVDPGNVLGLPDESMAIYGTRHWDRLGPANVAEMRRHFASWQFSQFLHGEQGAMICAAKIVETVPDMDAKFYAATQTMDEARHVAFGRMALRDYYRQLTAAELAEREDFVIEGCYLMRDRLRGDDIWANFGISQAEVRELTSHSDYNRAFRSLLFSRLVPCIRDIGLWSGRLRQAYADMGVLDCGRADLEALMRCDEQIAETLDAERFAAEEAARAGEVAHAIADGATG